MADFLGGLQSRRLAVLPVLLVSQLAGWLAVVVLVAVSSDPVPGLVPLAEAAGAGVAGVLALAAFYRALSVGTMSIVAPISATGAALPVVVGLLGGDHPGDVRLAGLAVAMVGVVLASREQVTTSEGDDAAPRGQGSTRAAAGRPLLLALVAAIGFGCFFVGMGRAAGHGTLWALLAARTPGLALLLLAARVRRQSMAVPRDRLALVVMAGLLDVSANGLYAVASTLGLLSVVSVLGSLYPVTTVLLARTLLSERIRRVQEGGVALVLGGVALIAAG